MSYNEYLDWIKYRNRWGTLHHGLRIDRALARSSAFFGNMMARKKSLTAEDFSVYDRPPEVEATAEDAYRMLVSIARTKSGG